MPTVVGAVDDDGVALADHLVDLPALVGEHSSEPQHRPLGALEALRLARSSAMLDAVGCDHLGESLDIAGREDLLPRPSGCCLDVLDHRTSVLGLAIIE